MQPVTQKNNKQGEGDCFPACLASILELPLEAFPTENCKKWNSFHWGNWLQERGITLYGPPPHKNVYHQGYWIATVPSLNNEGGYHAIVMEDDELAWDPNYGQKYKKSDLIEVRHTWLLVLSDMAAFKRSDLLTDRECTCPATQDETPEDSRWRRYYITGEARTQPGFIHYEDCPLHRTREQEALRYSRESLSAHQSTLVTSRSGR